MSALFSEKYSSENNNSLILPPSVTGNLYGFCTLIVKEIKWTTTKKFNLINLKIKWWGEKQGKTFKGIKSSTESLKVTTKRPLISICYHINTNFRLFQSYLNNCEPLFIEIFSSKTCDFIGSANFSVSKIQNISDENSSYKLTSNIMSTRDFKLGAIDISLKINMHKIKGQSIISLHSIKTTSEKEDQSHKQLKNKTYNETNKENIKIFGQKKAISFRDQKPVKVSTLKPSSRRSSISSKSVASSKSTYISATSSNSEKETYSVRNRIPLKLSMLNYLSGHSMPQNEENRILNEIIETSPTHSVIEEINKIDYSLPQNAKKTNDIETIQIHLLSLEFNAIGSNEVINYCKKLPNTKFIFKCAVTSKLLKAKNLNFISPVFDTPYKKIVFNKLLVQHVQVDRENAANVYINFGFCIESIEINRSIPHLIGFTRVNVADIIENKMMYTRKCAVIDEHNVIMGAVAVNIQIGNKFSSEINDLKECNNILKSTNNFHEGQSHSSQLLKNLLKITSHPITSNEHDCENHSEKQYDNKNMQTDPIESNSKMSQKEKNDFNDHHDTEMVDIEIKDNRKKSKVYQGLLFIEGLKAIKDYHGAEYFITYDGFWNDCQESTELSINCLFHYLKEFPVICDDEFLKRVKSNHMELKLWEKSSETSEKLIGTTKVSLHQFYIAFKDLEMIEHLSINKLPVISMDAWCNFISPLSNEFFCQGKILLAIGNENQIDYLKLSRNLHNLPPLQRTNYTQNQERTNIATNLNVDPNAQIKSKLTAFIESLSQKLPEPNIVNNHQSKQQSMSSSSSSSIVQNTNSQPQLRKTSDLLESLQKALQQPLPAMSSKNNKPLSLFSENPSFELSFNQTQLQKDCIKMNVIIEHASNLPKVIVKKCRNKRKNKGTPPQRVEYAPHTYATFEAATDHLNEMSLPSNTIKSHEGIVYCTTVINSCNPEWNQTFEAFVKFDILKNPQKKFVVKIWRKTAYNPTKVEAEPFEDSVIGFTAIDLSVLLTGLPVLSGYYNIIDFSGRCNGQLKITLKPLDDVSKFRNPESPLVPLMCPLSIDINSSESSNDGSNVLSRTLKRKFTELDEITQRLRARLFDVTKDDPDDEFERDLNTAVVEEEIDNENFNKEDFGWLKNDDESRNVLMNQAKSFEMEFNKVLESQEQSSSKNSSALTRRDTATGCSSSDENMQQQTMLPIDDLLKKYDLDTLINPNIFKNLLDPNCNSDSTPTLIPKMADDEIDVKADESDLTTVSSISNDQIQTIQKALQKTSLHDQNNSRKDPDGHHNISE